MTRTSKVVPELPGFVQKPGLYEQGADQFSETTRELKSGDEENLTGNAVYKRYFISVVLEGYDGFSNLLNPRGGQNESWMFFGTHFLVAVAKFNSSSMTAKLSQCITALMLLNNSSNEDSQRIFALSTAAPTGTTFSA